MFTPTKTAILPLLFALLFSSSLFSQTISQKTLPAVRTAGRIIIDGNLKETEWKTAPLATDFIQLRPTPFKHESRENRTEVYLLYSDDGVYIGGYCHEKSKDSIATELIGRDGFGTNDYIGVVVDTYKDKLNGFEYFITPLGEQMDAKFTSNSNNSEDFNWNAVWQSAAQMHNDGWSFEIFLPFSAIRFSTKPTQDWGLSITRRRRKSGEQFFWNPIDPNVNGFLTQEGLWTGLENIKPPVRLQFSPYFSTYVNHYPYNDPAIKNTTGSINGGMDVKYGINQSFTLDMTLVPDFGQVQSDNQVLNLTPFEVKYNENRSFFTEGTELFTKGNLFYSRRVGGIPLHHDDVVNELASNEHIVQNPTEAKLLNAAKISGRTEKNLGIGFFNAVTNTMYATVEDDKGNQRKIETSPLTNYNIFVLDQALKHNSSVSLINTNVTRAGKDYDANVTAALFDFNNKKNAYEWTGKIATSNKYGMDGNNQSGYSHLFTFGKTAGKFNFQLSQELVNKNYDINDMGILYTNNYLDHSLWLGYKWTKPTKYFNNLYYNLNTYYSRRIDKADFQTADFNTNLNGQLKNLAYAGISIWYDPWGHDYYEPRVDGRYFRSTEAKGIEVWYNSDFAKKYSYNIDLLHAVRTLNDGRRYDATISNQYRFTKKFSLAHSLYVQHIQNGTGYADMDGSDIIFGRRNQNTVENILNFKYNFTNKMGFTTRVRHYWSNVDYTEYFTLMQNGTLAKNTTYAGNANNNYNAFNIDAVFTWQIAPGSFVNIVYKSAVYTSDTDVTSAYMKDFTHTLQQPQNNNLSFKLIYFIDYLQLKKKK